MSLYSDSAFKRLLHKVNLLERKIEELNNSFLSIPKINNFKQEFTSIEVFERLITLRNEVRNGWRPNWRNMQTKYYINFDYEFPKVKSGISMFHLFSFETLEQADKFLKDNRELLEKIKELY